VPVGEVFRRSNSLFCVVKVPQVADPFRGILDFIKPLPVEDDCAMSDSPCTGAAFEAVNIPGSEDPIQITTFMLETVVGNEVGLAVSDIAINLDQLVANVVACPLHIGPCQEKHLGIPLPCALFHAGMIVDGVLVKRGKDQSVVTAINATAVTHERLVDLLLRQKRLKLTFRVLMTRYWQALFPPFFSRPITDLTHQLA